jgi:hypothetical protein
MRAGSNNDVSMGKALLLDAFEKKSESLARRVQHVGFADDDEEALERKLQTLSMSESLQG